MRERTQSITDNLSGTIVQTLYNQTIRPHLPRKFGVYAGVVSRDARLFDIRDHMPDYKRGLIDAIHDNVEEGDTVTLVGAGRGVSAIHCVRAGAKRVDAYEATPEMVVIASEAIDIEGASDQITHHRAIIGEAFEVYGDSSETDRLSPSELPAADVLLLDWQGAEKPILAGLESRYRHIIVETHPNYDAPTYEISSMLSEMGYLVDRCESRMEILRNTYWSEPPQMRAEARFFQEEERRLQSSNRERPIHSTPRGMPLV